MTNRTNYDITEEKGIWIPVWLLSILIHFAIFLFTLYLIPVQPVIHGAPGDPAAGNVGIVLKMQAETGAGTVYFNDDETFVPGRMANTEEIGDLDQEEEPSQIAERNSPGLTVHVLGVTTVQSIPDLTQSGQGTGNGIGTPGRGGRSKATVRVFGLKGTGHRFAFVFDRSSSMGEFGGKPIQAAKAELLQAIDGLQSIHQLMILFYNEKSDLIFPNPKSANQLVYATDVNKELARSFIGSVFPEGGTKHADALLHAARFKPDVIFLLTDGESKDDPKAGERDRISRAIAGIQINVIQFGIGPTPPQPNYLQELARSNAGAYQYMNLEHLEE